jgi:hypothetical protein
MQNNSAVGVAPLFEKRDFTGGTKKTKTLSGEAAPSVSPASLRLSFSPPPPPPL